MARRSNFETFPKSFIVPLGLAFLLTASIVLTNGFQDSQDIRSRAARKDPGPYNTPTPTTGATYIQFSTLAGQNCDTRCNDKDSFLYDYRCTSVGLEFTTYPQMDGDYFTIDNGACTRATGATCTYTFKAYTPKGTTCEGQSAEYSTCNCLVTPL